MTSLRNFRASGRLPKVRHFLIVFCLGAASLCAYSQASPPDDTQQDSPNSLDQSSMYPVQSQMVEAPNLNSLNENADTVRNSDTAPTRGPLFFALEAAGTATTNLQDAYDSQPSTAGGYLTFGVPVGVHLWTPITDFSAYFKYDTDLYPSDVGLNHSSEIYSHQLTHRFSDTTTTSWSLAGGHIVTLGRYLSPVIGVGTTGVVAPQEASGLQPLTDAATTYSISHQTSERDSWTAAGTAGWIDQPVLGAVAGSGTTSYRQITGGGDIQWHHALNSREIAGVEVNDVYVKGISPSGMSNFMSAKATFGQTLTPHSSVYVGAGPLYTHSGLAGTPDQDNFSYTANANFDYRRAFGHINTGYSRVYEIEYLSPTSVANELYFSFDRPLTAKVFLSADSQYLHSSLQQNLSGYSTFGYTARLDMYLARNLAYHVDGSSFIQQAGGGILGYRENSVSTGITLYIGSRFARSGDQ